MKYKTINRNVPWEVDEFIYHYCSISALYGILASKSIWLTSLESTNDSKELKLAKSIIDKALNEILETTTDEKTINLLNMILKSPKNKTHSKNRVEYKYFGASFSSKVDNLTHWERYADSARGVCIKFNASAVKYMFDQNGASSALCTWFTLEKIIYNNVSQVQVAKEFILNHINELFEVVGDLIYTNDLFSFSIYQSALSSLKPVMKHDGFTEEKEYKYWLEEGQPESFIELLRKSNNESVINSANRLERFINEKGISRDKKRYGVFGNEIRGYYSLNLEQVWSSNLISEIIIGPKCYQNSNELKGFLHQSGLKRTKICVSKLPLR